MPSLSGSCLCGAVRITIADVAPVNEVGTEICHCTDCRQFTGALAPTFVMAERANITIGGEENVKSYATTVKSGTTLARHWCALCGSSLYDSSSQEGRTTLTIHAGHFPPGTLPAPSLELYLRSAEKWEKPYEGAKAYNTQP